MPIFTSEAVRKGRLAFASILPRVDTDRRHRYLDQWDTSPQREAFYLEG